MCPTFVTGPGWASHLTALWRSLTLLAFVMHFTGLWDFGQQDHCTHQDMTRFASGDIPLVWEMDWSSQRRECWLSLARGLESLLLETEAYLEPFRQARGGRWQKRKL